MPEAALRAGTGQASQWTKNTAMQTLQAPTYNLHPCPQYHGVPDCHPTPTQLTAIPSHPMLTQLNTSPSNHNFYTIGMSRL